MADLPRSEVLQLTAKLAGLKNFRLITAQFVGDFDRIEDEFGRLWIPEEGAIFEPLDDAAGLD